MPDYFKKIDFYRIIDANINRLKEGLRVLEEITRFILRNRSLTAEFKAIRHKVDALMGRLPKKHLLLQARRIQSDVGRTIHALGELKRKDYRDIFFANIQRVKESIRVLEEFTKLNDSRIALKFKKIRYLIYELEKKVFKNLP